MEKIVPTPNSPQSPQSFATKIVSTREESIEEEAKDQAEYKIYSDGSGNNENTGAAAVMYRKGQVPRTRSLQLHMGPRSKHNTYEAEVVGAILGLWLAHEMPETRNRKVSLYIDNQALVRALSDTKAKSGQHLLEEIKRIANDTRCDLTVRWISGHSKVRGNEEVDEMAKQASADRTSSRDLDLPPKLRKPIVMSASAEKQRYHGDLMEEWLKEWAMSPRKRRMTEIDKGFPYSRFRRSQDRLSRAQASRLFQVRCRHIPLNVYLHRIGKAETRMCLKCNDTAEDEQRPETVNHFIFDCPAYDDERRELEKAMGRRDLTLQLLMKDEKGMKALAKYMARTGRLKDTR